MNTKSLVIRRSFLVTCVGVALIASGDRCVSQDAEHKENELRQIEILLGAEGLDVVSPELNGEEPGLPETPMLPPGTESISELHSPDNLGIGRRNLEPRHVQSVQRSNPKTKYLREQISQQIDFLARQGNDVQQLKELVERLQFALESSERETTRDVEVSVFAVPDAGQEGPQHPGHPRVGLSFSGPPPAGPPGFSPPGLRMEGRAQMHQVQGRQIRHPEADSNNGQFAEDRRRIVALIESAERITQAGLPDVAHGLRERAEQLERELAEKQERMQQEERQRTESAMRERQEQARQQSQRHEQARQQPQRLMEHRREEIERGESPAPPLRELHEQMEQLRHDMHKLSEQMADLTRLSSERHNPGNDGGRHDDMDDEEDGDDEEDSDDDEEDMDDEEDGDDEEEDMDDEEDGDDEEEDMDDAEDGDDEDDMDDDEDSDDEDDDMDDDDDDDDDDRKERGEHEKE